LYAKYFNRYESVDLSGDGAGDDWDMGRAGFRIDWDELVHDSFTLQGDLYDGELGAHYFAATPIPPYAQAIKADVDTSGTDILGRWNHFFSDGSDITVQLYYDWY